MSFVERAELIINTIEYLTIATVCPDGTPWNSPVYTSFDENLNFHWKSWTENQHSRNIGAGATVFTVIYDSRAKAGEGEGVFMKGFARPLMAEDEAEIRHAYDLSVRRAGRSASTCDSLIEGNPRRVYKFTPSQIWMNDGSTKNGSFIDVRHELDIEMLKKEIQQYIPE
ncbi:MAG: hypothetical protein H6868_06405 [Rhodospirillales bacterium]|nr:hypothetical protein [Rhodospirillales bacterium]